MPESPSVKSRPEVREAAHRPLQPREPVGRLRSRSALVASRRVGLRPAGRRAGELPETETIGQPGAPGAARDAEQTRARRPGSFALNAAIATAGLGLLVVAFLAYLFGFTSIEAFRSQRTLEQQLGGAAGLAALNGRTPAAGQPVAIVAIPALGVRQVVVEGTTSGDLEVGPGLLIGSAPPGTAGNVVIAGRRTTYGAPFSRLPSLTPGAVVEVTGALGRFDYTVTSAETIKPGSGLPASPTTAGRLTLVTSTPAYGPSALYVVSAKLNGKPVASVPLTSAAVPPADFGLAGDGTALAPSLLWAEGLIAALLLAWYFVRRSRKPWLVYGLATPTVIALALLCFGNVAALLPATL